MIVRLAFITFCGAFGMWCLAHGAQHLPSHGWIGTGLILLCLGLALCMPRVRIRMDWGWVFIIRDLTRRMR